jgi:hypothetical protein
VDGRMAVESPPGQGTRVHAAIPCNAGALVADASADPLKRAASVLQASGTGS